MNRFSFCWVATVLVAVGLCVPAASGQGTGGPVGEDVTPVLMFGPVDGFTTTAHEVPEALALPFGHFVEFSVGHLRPGQTVTWVGGSASGETLVVPCLNPGSMLVSCTIEPDGVQLECPIWIVPITPESLTFDYRLDANRSFLTEREMDNDFSVEIWKQHSIARLHELPPPPDSSGPVGGRQVADQYFATAVDTPIRMTARADSEDQYQGFVNVGLSGLIEWRVGGEAVGVGSAQHRYVQGVNVIEVGPPGHENLIEIMAYEVAIHGPAETEWDVNFPITFTASTEPAGYEHLVSWIAATKFGSALPRFGSGATFTTRFEDTLGPAPPGAAGQGYHLWQWIGVRSDSSTAGLDEKVIEIEFCDATCAQDPLNTWCRYQVQMSGFAADCPNLNPPIDIGDIICVKCPILNQGTNCPGDANNFQCFRVQGTNCTFRAARLGNSCTSCLSGEATYAPVP